MKELMRLVSFVVGAFAIACGPSSPSESPTPEGQSFEAAMDAICNVDARAALNAADDPIGVGSDRHEWVFANVENPDAIELWTLLRVRSFADQAKALNEAAKKASLDSCALANSLAEEPTSE